MNLRSFRLLGIALAVVLSLPTPHAVAAWESAKEITSTPLHEGVPLTAQFRYTFLPDFSPGPRMRVIRFKGAGILTTYSKDEMGTIGKRLLSKLDKLEAARLPPGRNGGRPVYFANSRFFLVAAKPAVLAIVPHEFIPARDAFTTSTIHGMDLDGLYHDLFEKERKDSNLYAFLERVEDPAWLNYLELSAVVPNSAGIRVISDLWNSPVALESAQEDPRWPFRVIPSVRFPGFLEFVGRTAQQK